jgi:glyoxylase-like metal-dependent hydrolase (beta-lactamase superfamily II)
MDLINSTTRQLDLSFLGRPHVIATGVVQTPAGVLLVDPGPASCLPTLRAELAAAGIGPKDLAGLLLTHIHLDHAGATGVLVREFPHLTAYVHERGAAHLVDPSKLLASATRLYGADMDRLWGEFAAVPADRVRPLAGGERLDFNGYPIEVAYTPGHASHHVSYHDEATGILYAGDTGGIRIAGQAYVLPPTPPPDIDFDLWRASLAQFRRWAPTGVFVTHFGFSADAEAHLEMLAEELDAWERVSRDLIDLEAPDARSRRFAEGVIARITDRVGPDAAAAYQAAVPLDHCWAGLQRYWEKKSRG